MEVYNPLNRNKIPIYNPNMPDVYGNNYDITAIYNTNLGLYNAIISAYFIIIKPVLEDIYEYF